MVSEYIRDIIYLNRIWLKISIHFTEMETTDKKNRNMREGKL